VTEELAERLRSEHPDVVVARGEVSVLVAPPDLIETLRRLRDDQRFGFTFLSDLAATDWPGREPRFWLAYHLHAPGSGERLRVKAGLPGDDPRAPTVTGLFPTADWFEREVFDFFGVVFDGHPDLRRIELPDEWETFPLRKDHPLAGVDTRYRGASVPPPDQRGQ
jgi:NADH-quinone oxidoreductase subunit C